MLPSVFSVYFVSLMNFDGVSVREEEGMLRNAWFKLN